MRKIIFRILFFFPLMVICGMLFAWRAQSDGLRGVIAFAMERNGESQIYLVNPDGRNPRRVIRDGRDPSFTPGAQTITFVRNNDIYQVNMDGSRLRRVVNVRSGRYISNPVMSEDRSLIVYNVSSSTRSATSDIHLYRTDGSGERVIRNGRDPSFTPDQVVILFARSNAIYSLSRSLMSERPYTPNLYYQPRVNGTVRYPVYGPGDFSGVVFNIRQSARADWNIRTILYRQERRPEVSLATNAMQPAFSPDGDYITFVRNGDLYIMRADGSRQTRIVRGPGAVSHPSWWMARNY